MVFETRKFEPNNNIWVIMKIQISIMPKAISS